MVEQKAAVASEAQEQAAVIRWWGLVCGRYGVPELCLMHIANEGTRSAARGRLMKSQGVRAGVSDLFLSVPRGGFCGLWIEMKRKGGRVSPEQTAFLEHMKAMGYDGAVCRGADEAMVKIHSYITAKEGE